MHIILVRTVRDETSRNQLSLPYALPRRKLYVWYMRVCIIQEETNRYSAYSKYVEYNINVCVMRACTCLCMYARVSLSLSLSFPLLVCVYVSMWLSSRLPLFRFSSLIVPPSLSLSFSLRVSCLETVSRENAFAVKTYRGPLSRLKTRR